MKKNGFSKKEGEKTQKEGKYREKHKKTDNDWGYFSIAVCRTSRQPPA
ncbi:MAG: hypothetical protein J1F40_04640 [Prevotellaceae bacterium]|nr:hypothetical protein [Prevotellaceae bacterium]